MLSLLCLSVLHYSGRQPAALSPQGNLSNLSNHSKEIVSERDKMTISVSGQGNWMRGHQLGEVTTLVGGREGYANGLRMFAQLKSPHAILINRNGDYLISDTANHCVRLMDKSGTLTTFAGVCELKGPVQEHLLSAPMGMVLLPSGAVLLADAENNCIAKLSPTGEVSLFAGNMGGAAGYDEFPVNSAAEINFDRPTAVAVDSKGNVLVADTGNKCIRMLDAAGTTIRTLVGDGSKPAGHLSGQGMEARLNSPGDMVWHAESRTLYVLDSGSSCILAVTNSDSAQEVGGKVSDYWCSAELKDAGGLTALLPAFHSDAKSAPASTPAPGNTSATAISQNASMPQFYISDTGNNRVLKLTPSKGLVVLATGGPGHIDGKGMIMMNGPTGLTLSLKAFDGSKNADELLIVDTNNHAIRVLSWPMMLMSDPSKAK